MDAEFVHGELERLYSRELASVDNELPAVLVELPIPRFSDSAHRSIPVAECGERMVDGASLLQTLDVYERFGIGDGPTHWVRSSVAQRLVEVHAALISASEGRVGLVLIEGWRSVQRQRLLFELAKATAGDDPETYATNPDDSHGVIPPHATGGAVDVTLSIDRRPAALGSPPGVYESSARLHALERSKTTIRSLRRVLFHSMAAYGFAGFEGEWWHFSYGDQPWAATYQVPEATYGLIDPTHSDSGT